MTAPTDEQHELDVLHRAYRRCPVWCVEGSVSQPGVLEHCGPETILELVDEDGPTSATLYAHYAHWVGAGEPSIRGLHASPVVAISVDVSGSLQLAAEDAQRFSAAIVAVAATISADPIPQTE